MNELLKNFIIGGVVVSSITYLTKKADPKIASVIWSFPIKLITALTLLWLNHTNSKEIEILGYSAVKAILNKIVFVIAFANVYGMQHNFVLAMMSAILLWFIGSSIILQ